MTYILLTAEDAVCGDLHAVDRIFPETKWLPYHSLIHTSFCKECGYLLCKNFQSPI